MKRPRLLRDRAHARLLLAARGGDSDSFRRLYRETLTPVSRYLEARLNRREEAEDLTSTVFHRLVDRLDSFDPERGSVLSWLLTMAHNALVDHYRSQKQSMPVEHLEAVLAGTEPSALEEVLRDEKVRRVRELVRELPTETRRILALRFDQDLRYRDIAVCMGLSEAAVKQRFSRGLRRLEARWAEELGPKRAEEN